jgi:ABC-type multidrug transport system fused ATPase/permease subunit
MNQIEQDIEVLSSHLAHFMPKRLKRILMSAATFVILFYISWQLAIVSIGGIIVIGICKLFSERQHQNRINIGSSYKEELFTIAANSFQISINDFNFYANEFDNKNEEIWAFDRSTVTRYSFSRFLLYCAIFAYRLIVIWYCCFNYWNHVNSDHN